jgi:hypothetical protein
VLRTSHPAHFTAAGEAVVELLTCCGEPVDVMTTSDRALLAYLRLRPSSSCDEPGGQL